MESQWEGANTHLVAVTARLVGSDAAPVLIPHGVHDDGQLLQDVAVAHLGTRGEKMKALCQGVGHRHGTWYTPPPHTYSKINLQGRPKVAHTGHPFRFLPVEELLASAQPDVEHLWAQIGAQLVVKLPATNAAAAAAAAADTRSRRHVVVTTTDSTTAKAIPCTRVLERLIHVGGGNVKEVA
jgi:hypothetical protein